MAAVLVEAVVAVVDVSVVPGGMLLLVRVLVSALARALVPAPVPVLVLTLVLLMLVRLPMSVPMQSVEPALVPMRELVLLMTRGFFCWWLYRRRRPYSSPRHRGKLRGCLPQGFGHGPAST